MRRARTYRPSAAHYHLHDLCTLRNLRDATIQDIARLQAELRVLRVAIENRKREDRERRRKDKLHPPVIVRCLVNPPLKRRAKHEAEKKRRAGD